MGVRELERRLLTAGVPLHKWGVGQAKTVQDLWEEIKTGETELIYPEEGSGGVVLRKVRKVHIYVFRFHHQKGKLEVLCEQSQYLPNGEVRKRSRTRSVSEKQPRHEEPVVTAQRALREELNLKVSHSVFWKLLCPEPAEPKASEVFPGLMKQSIVSYFAFYMDFKDSKPYYMEVKKFGPGLIRRTPFIWKPFATWPGARQQKPPAPS